MDENLLGLQVCLYRVGQNMNVAYRTCEFFGVQKIMTHECTGELKGNLYKAKDRVQIEPIDTMPTGEGVLYFETNGKNRIEDVDWKSVNTVCIGGETSDFTTKEFKGVPKVAIARRGCCAECCFVRSGQSKKNDR
jgi:hypothetical protein